LPEPANPKRYYELIEIYHVSIRLSLVRIFKEIGKILGKVVDFNGIQGHDLGMGNPQRAQERAQARILIADDDRQVRRLFAETLISEGYEVLEAPTGKKALDTLRSTVCDILILDLSMPDQDGFDVLRELRYEMPELKIVVISGYMQGAFLEAASFLGAMETLGKPTTPKILAETVRRILAQR